MTTLSDTPGDGLDVDRAIELAWNMARCSSPTDRMYWEGELRAYLAASPSVASDTAALPSGYEGLVERGRSIVDRRDFTFSSAWKSGPAPADIARNARPS